MRRYKMLALGAQGVIDLFLDMQLRDRVLTCAGLPADTRAVRWAVLEQGRAEPTLGIVVESASFPEVQPGDMLEVISIQLARHVLDPSAQFDTLAVRGILMRDEENLKDLPVGGGA